MNVEREYYENDGFWRDAALGQHDLERVNTLTGMIPSQADSLLELGCGNGIFVNGLKKSNRQFSQVVGLDRSVSALNYVRVPRVCASIDNLPFADGMFDCVAALEVLEHLPVRIYESALGELCRMSRRFALVSVPYRQNLEESLIECPSCASRFNPDYHMRSFDEVRIGSLLSSFGFKCRRIERIAPYFQFRGIATFRGMTRRRPAGGNPFPTEIPCPMCGYYLPAGNGPSTGAQATNGKAGGGIKPLLKKVWPQEESFIWIAGLYERAA